MKFTLAAVALALMACAGPARADGIPPASFPMEGGGLFTIGFGLGPAETFGTSFIFDSTTLLVSDMSFTAQGLLGGGFVFAGVTQFDSQITFEWSNGQALIVGDIPDLFFVEAAAGIPVSPGSHDFALTCLTAACVADFSNGHPGRDSLGFLLPETPVPEPPTVALLGVVLIAGILIRGRRILRTV